MSCRDTAKRARIIALIQTKQIQLEKLYATFERALETDAERYRFDSNEGSQQTWRRKLDEMKGVIDSLESEIDSLYRRLECAGVVNMNLRRKRGPFGRTSC